MTGLSTDNRQLLEVSPAPGVGAVSIVTLSNILGDSLALAVTYVPDEMVLTRAGFDAYVRALASAPATTAEALAALIAGDIANELVPKWLRVTVNRQQNGVVNHSVTVEDRQPGWDHAAAFKSA
jgi:7-cyano-7-deazaguanine reductase